MYKSRLLPLPVLILSALNAYAANTPNPLDQIDKNVPNQFDKDFRDNLDQIHSVEIQKREQSAWDLQKNKITTQLHKRGRLKTIPNAWITPVSNFPALPLLIPKQLKPSYPNASIKTASTN